MRTTGHKVLITGGTRGIGLAIAERFAAAGNDIIVVGSSTESIADVLNSHPGWTGYACDLANANDRSSIIRELNKCHTDLSVVVNNAGIQADSAILGGDLEALQREIAINIEAVAHFCQALVPLLQNNSETALVNVSSGLAIAPKASAPVYCASKAFIRSYSVALRYQLEELGISVFDLAPPLVATDMTAGRNEGAMSVEGLAASFWTAWASDQFYIPAGQTRLLEFVHRLSPRLARRIMKNK